MQFNGPFIEEALKKSEPSSFIGMIGSYGDRKDWRNYVHIQGVTCLEKDCLALEGTPNHEMIYFGHPSVTRYLMNKKLILFFLQSTNSIAGSHHTSQMQATTAMTNGSDLFGAPLIRTLPTLQHAQWSFPTRILSRTTASPGPPRSSPTGDPMPRFSRRIACPMALLIFLATVSSRHPAFSSM